MDDDFGTSATPGHDCSLHYFCLQTVISQNFMFIQQLSSKKCVRAHPRMLVGQTHASLQFKLCLGNASYIQRFVTDIGTTRDEAEDSLCTRQGRAHRSLIQHRIQCAGEPHLPSSQHAAFRLQNAIGQCEGGNSSQWQ